MDVCLAWIEIQGGTAPLHAKGGFDLKSQLNFAQDLSGYNQARFLHFITIEVLNSNLCLCLSDTSSFS